MATTEDLSKLTDEQLQAKIDEAEKRREQKRGVREVAIKRKTLEERGKLTDLEQEYGELGVDIKEVFSPIDGRMVVVKRPKPITFNRFESRYNTKQGPSEAEMTDFLYANLVYPTKAEFETICDSCPAIRSAAIGAAASLAQAGKIDIEGK